MASPSPSTPKPNEALTETLDRHRTRLETSLGKLRKALLQWQTYSAEYEALTEELGELPENASREDMIKVGDGFGGTVVDSSEVLALMGDKVNIRRTRDQTIAAVRHRIQYVTENIGKIEAQIEKGEFQLSSLYVVQGGAEVTTETGDPVIEIVEELDDDDNVISSSTSISGKGSASKMSLADLEKFEKMMKNLEKQGEKGSQGPSAVISAREGAPGPSRVEEVRKIAQENGTNATNSGYDEIPVHEIRIDDESVGKKGPDARQTVHDQPLSPAETPLSPTPKSSLRKISQELPEAAAVTPRALQPMEEDFVLTVDEPPDEADLRRQMIDYNLHDIGSVVAELTLEEEGEDGYDDDEYDYGEDSDDSDQYGRSTRPMITPEIHREMQALQARIQARMELEKKDKPQTQPEDDETKPEQRALEIKISQDESHNSQATASPKKGVRFSNVLDVSPAPPPLPPSQQPTAPVSQQQGYILPPLPNPDPEDAVPFLVELLAREQMLEDLKSQGLNTKGNGPAENEQDQVGGERAVQKEKKVSRFKAMRSGTVEESDIPIQENEKAKEVNSQALKTSIIERAPGPATAPSIPVAPPAMSANDKPKKISRFKAAKSVESLPVGIKQLTTEPSAGIYENSFAYRKFLDDNQEDDSANQEKKARPLVASTVIERPPTVISTSSPSVIPAAPDELDPAIHRQEVAVDFFKSRNKLIQKEGGFLSRDEDQMYVPIEDENVGKKKVSRFKAARVGGQR